MIKFNIEKPDNRILEKLKHKIDNKTKPVGSLGTLEKIAARIGLIQQSLQPELKKPTILVFAGDHGIALEGASPYPQEVTWQMVMNFVGGGAAINVFTRQHGMNIKVVDAGVNYDFDTQLPILNQKLAYGTKSFLNGPAMTEIQCEEALNRGAAIVEEQVKTACNVIGFGEMGIGNTAASSMLMHRVCGIPLEDCVGRGTGHDEAGLQRKLELLHRANNQFTGHKHALGLMAWFGGFELAMACGAILKAAEKKMTILIDGFNISASLLIAQLINKDVMEYCIFTHQSEEKGHQLMIEHLGGEPLLRLNMRLGEGTGAAIAYPLVESAVRFLNEMASFEEANVSQNEDTLDENISTL